MRVQAERLLVWARKAWPRARGVQLSGCARGLHGQASVPGHHPGLGASAKAPVVERWGARCAGPARSLPCPAVGRRSCGQSCQARALCCAGGAKKRAREDAPLNDTYASIDWKRHLQEDTLQKLVNDDLKVGGARV